MVHSHILEGNLLFLLKREVIEELGLLEDSKFTGCKSYNLLETWKAMALVTF